MNLLSWDFTGEIMGKIEAFEREVSLYEASSKVSTFGALFANAPPMPHLATR